MKLILKRAFLLSLLLLVACGLLAATPSEQRSGLYRNARQGIEFRFPLNWTYEKCDQAVYGPGDCLGFRQRARGRRRHSSDYLMMVTLSNVGLEKAAEKDGLFEKQNGQWIKHGRFETVKASHIRGQNWRGIYAVADCGISDENGFHAAAGQCLAALLSDGNRTATIETDGTTDTDRVLSQVIKSFKFINGTPPPRTSSAHVR